MNIVEQLDIADLKDGFWQSLRGWVSARSATVKSPFGDIFVLRSAADGGRELRLLVSRAEAQRAAQVSAATIVSVSNQCVPLDVEIGNLRSREGWECALRLKGYWSVRDPRKFLTGFGLDRVDAEPISDSDVIGKIAALLQPELAQTTPEWGFRDLKGKNVFSTDWFHNQFDYDGALEHAGLAVHVSETCWSSADAEKDEAYRREMEEAERRRKADLTAVRHNAGIAAITADTEATTAKAKLEVARWQAQVDVIRARALRQEAETERARMAAASETARNKSEEAKNDAERDYWREKERTAATESENWATLLGRMQTQDARMAEALDELRKQWAMSMEFLQSVRAEREASLAAAREPVKQDLTLDVRWRAFEAPVEGDTRPLPPVKKDALDKWDMLQSGDAVQVCVTPSEDVHLYLFAVGPYAASDGGIEYQWRTLFGDACQNDLQYPLWRAEGNRAAAGREFCLPTDAADEADFRAHAWALNWDCGGMELMFLVACRRLITAEEIGRLLVPIPKRKIVGTRGFATYENKGNELPHPPPPRISAAFHAAAGQILGDDAVVHGLAIVHL